MTANDLIRELLELSSLDRGLSVEGVEAVNTEGRGRIVRLKRKR